MPNAADLRAGASAPVVAHTTPSVQYDTAVGASVPSADLATTPVGQGERAPRPVEIGGPQGPEPTRFGDWERKGRCIDF
ncbi:MAG TPA: DUF1674 domain-containing protein [Steroidobacteraceae bacterium]|nr:DUF1674 domain-containing protein [Steroidobacteraceae bacterium]